jgi:AraC-like DNA-binding protein
MEFDAYLRLSGASSMEWSAAFCRLSGCDQVKCVPELAGSPVGSLSALTLDNGALCYFSADQSFRMEDLDCRFSSLILVRRGEVALTAGDISLQPGDLCCLPGGSGGDMLVSKGARVLIIKWFAGPSAACCRQPTPVTRSGIPGMLDDFMQRSRFFSDHEHALASGSELLDTLQKSLSSDLDISVPKPVMQDKRVQRAVEHIEQNRQWSFSLAELAGIAGVSERNLYYLMRRETGLTPYRFYQRCRLLRVRLRLVNCQCNEPHISWYASDEGFSHLGRFAGLYREHFGELPSETVQWRTSLTDSVLETED